MRLRKIDENTYVEDFGMYLEQFKPGMVIKHKPGRTITESDNTWMTLLSMNQHPIHFDAELAKESEFKQRLVNSVVTFAIINGMTVSSISAKAIANLGWDKVRLLNPVFIGDTLYAQSEVLNVRPSKSRPGQGIVTIITTGTNQRGEVVLSCERSVLIPSQSAPKS
ncbi:MAG: MaoC family dehydratase [Psychrobium sp.]|nr:MaoC family dehydratase [Psychrobium sp.]